jgi:hypothetical protein
LFLIAVSTTGTLALRSLSMRLVSLRNSLFSASVAPSGGLGGGGNGNYDTGQNGVSGLGGGGGAGERYGVATTGAGGSGIVIVRYLT